MKPSSNLNRLIDNTIDDPELKQLLFSTPELVGLQDEIRKQFQLYEEQIRRYQERLRFNIKDTHNKNSKDVKSLTYKAYHDELTGLPNRTYFFERIESAILQAHRSANPFAIMFIDLDGFKAINDNYGHDFGDKMLKLVAERLIEITRETDMVARLAGDEYSVHLMNMESAAQSARVAKAIIEGFTKPINIDNNEFLIDLSIGISHYPMDGQTTQQLLKNADVAMYEAKKRGTNLFQFYEKRLTEKVTERLQLEKELLTAIENGDVELSFQPYLNLKSGQIAAIDVDVKWQHPDKGIINCSQVFQQVSNSQILMSLLQWQISACCNLQKIWYLKGYPEVRIRLLIDERQLLHKDLLSCLAKGIESTGHVNTNIELVIHDTSLNKNYEQIKRVLVQSGKLGFKTGILFSAIGFLPVTTLHDCGIHSLSIVHDTFVQEGESDTDIQAELINGFNSLCKATDMKLLISGISNDAQKKLYLKQGIYTLSGSHFSEQQTAKDFELVLKRFKDSNPANSNQTLIDKTA